MNLSVVIVSYNTKELLKACLESLKVATKNIQSEVFVVDNNSHDGTTEMVKENFPYVNLTANKDNKGYSKANNQALKKAKGEYVLVLNPDTVVQKDTVEKMIKFMDKDKHVGVSTCRVELPSEDIDPDCRRHFPTPWKAFTHFSGLSKLFPNTKLFDSYYMRYLKEDQEHEVDSCVGAFMMMNKSAMDKVGLFDEDFFFYGEDLDLCWRFKKRGYKIIYTPITKIIHYKGAASGMKQTSKHLTKATRDSKRRAIKESTRAMELFYKKHFTREYPLIVTWLVLSTIKIIAQIRLLKI